MAPAHLGPWAGAKDSGILDSAAAWYEVWKAKVQEPGHRQKTARPRRHLWTNTHTAHSPPSGQSADHTLSPLDSYVLAHPRMHLYLASLLSDFVFVVIGKIVRHLILESLYSDKSELLDIECFIFVFCNALCNHHCSFPCLPPRETQSLLRTWATILQVLLCK